MPLCNPIEANNVIEIAEYCTFAFYLQVVRDGYEFYAERKLVTIFSAPKYGNDFDNTAAVMCVDRDLYISIRQFKPNLPK